ncbi:MAG: hypothetical protein M5U19_22495 [Microthrixaceae bacterium]|nr:hypothetical protein [Microthrixaceae bacterium]
MLHYTWIAFFMTFYVWFNLAPLATTILDEADWLTAEHLKILAIANVAFTIPARIVIGALVDRFGSRVVFSALMVTMAVPTLALRVGQLVHAVVHRPVGARQRGRRVRRGHQDGRPVVPSQVHRPCRGVHAGWGQLRIRLGSDDPAVVRHHGDGHLVRHRRRLLALGDRGERPRDGHLRGDVLLPGSATRPRARRSRRRRRPNR